MNRTSLSDRALHPSSVSDAVESVGIAVGTVGNAGSSTSHGPTRDLRVFRAEDGIRTRDPHLGKVMRYHCATSAWAPQVINSLAPANLVRRVSSVAVEP